MSVPVFLNLFNKSRKSFFRNEFDTFNNTEAQILGYVYHISLKSLE